MQYQRVDLGPGYELLLPFDENCTPAYDWICQCCDFFPGNDGSPSEGSGLTQKQYLAAYRKRWLDAHDWKAEYVNQLRDVFQLGEQDVEAIKNASALI
jgi:hypothetical protein